MPRRLTLKSLEQAAVPVPHALAAERCSRLRRLVDDREARARRTDIRAARAGEARRPEPCHSASAIGVAAVGASPATRRSRASMRARARAMNGRDGNVASAVASATTSAVRVSGSRCAGVRPARWSRVAPSSLYDARTSADGRHRTGCRRDARASAGARPARPAECVVVSLGARGVTSAADGRGGGVASPLVEQCGSVGARD